MTTPGSLTVVRFVPKEISTKLNRPLILIFNVWLVLTRPAVYSIRVPGQSRQARRSLRLNSLGSTRCLNTFTPLMKITGMS